MVRIGALHFHCNAVAPNASKDQKEGEKQSQVACLS